MNPEGIRKELVVSRLLAIIQKFRVIRPCVADTQLRLLYQKKDLAGMVAFIKRDLALSLRIKLALVNSGGPPNAPAFIIFPEKLPIHGSIAFKNTEAILHIRKTFIAQAKFESLVYAFTHELCHVLLAVFQMQFDDEEAVDLTTMVMGYRNFLRLGCKYTAPPELQTTPGYETIFRTGYLTEEEINFAYDLIDFHIKVMQL